MKRVFAWGLAVGLAAAGAGASFAGPAEQTAIKAGCQKSTNWSEKACQCLADKSGALNAAQQSFLAATLNQQKPEAAQFAAQLTPAQAVESSMFMVKAGPGCQ